MTPLVISTPVQEEEEEGGGGSKYLYHTVYSVPNVCDSTQYYAVEPMTQFPKMYSKTSILSLPRVLCYGTPGSRRSNLVAKESAVRLEIVDF